MNGAREAHTWENCQGYRPEEKLRLVKCTACGIFAITIDGEYVHLDLMSGSGSADKLVWEDHQQPRFREAVARLSEPCWKPVPAGTNVYARSTNEWFVMDPKGEECLRFTLVAAVQGRPSGNGCESRAPRTSPGVST